MPMNFFSEDPNKHKDAIESMKQGAYETIPIEVTEEQLAELSRGNEGLEELFKEVMRYCCRYAEDVWAIHEHLAQGISDKQSSEKFQEQDEARSRLHTAVIDSFNILSRGLVKEGRDNSWMTSLVYAGEGSRAAYGRLALLLAYRHYLKLNREVQHDEGN